eukprot:CAMPEP_0171337932 /NCGR_PEP_ID=MMETSP0878-20121228/7000_1 /TAXON_ID=67004 /ORGANISM="Thalassiosira weissflogii, Strain CCMP1336" /LENGTH=141 /DNA_ID=CAMNT_0011839625 /DNA_START=139 /DNA_END=560 /DNA_ORIENTATION=-
MKQPTLLIAATAVSFMAVATAEESSSIATMKSSGAGPQHLNLRGQQPRQLQDPNRPRQPHQSHPHPPGERSLQGGSYCGTNWQNAFDTCELACSGDADCPPGVYCFNFLECTPPIATVAATTPVPLTLDLGQTETSKAKKS